MDFRVGLVHGSEVWVLTSFQVALIHGLGAEVCTHISESLSFVDRKFGVIC